MQITDSIADLLTRIRNASARSMTPSKSLHPIMKKSIVQILVDEGYEKLHSN